MATYTYADDPDSDGTAAQKRDAVRFLIQDTTTAAGAAGGRLVTDAQIAFAIAEEMNVYTAAAAICDILVAQAKGVRSKSVGDVSVSYDAGFYESLGKRLRKRGETYVSVYAGGQSVSDKETDTADTDRVQPSFAIRDFEYEGAGTVEDERDS